MSLKLTIELTRICITLRYKLFHTDELKISPKLFCFLKLRCKTGHYLVIFNVK